MDKSVYQARWLLLPVFFLSVGMFLVGTMAG
jgi:hypothetical protein